MEIQGKIIQVLPKKEGVGKNGNPWAIQPFVIETQESYPKKVYIELFGEDRIKANPVDIDMLVDCGIDIESREFNGLWYTQVRAWKVQTAENKPAGSDNVIKPDVLDASKDSDLVF